MLAVFLFMASFSAYIGWSTKNTIRSVYAQTVKEMTAQGIKEIPNNPFLSTPPLSILKNMVVYVFLIGSLMAIIIGHSSFIRERRAGVSKIIFSKSIGKWEFVLGKMGGIFLALMLINVISFALSFFSITIIFSHFLSISEAFNLLAFYGTSLVYMLFFAYLGLFFAIVSKSESLALLAPVMFWIFISFVMPQLTSALDPTALLNPTSIQTPAPQNNFFQIAQSIIHPFSVSESYKSIGRSLLQGDSSSYPLFPLVVYLIVVAGSCFYGVKQFNICEAEIDQ